MTKRTHNSLFIGAALGAVFASPVGAFAQHGPPASPVVVADVVERDLPISIKLVATVRSDREAVVAAEVSGLVSGLPAGEGQFVEQGDVLCELNAETAELLLAGSQARLENLRSRLEELENGTREETIRELGAQVEEADAMFDKWEFERKRVAELFSRNQSSAKEQHDTEMEYIAARQRLARYKASLEIAVNGPRKEEIAQARYDVAAQEAVVGRLTRDLAKTKIRAPFAGFVVAKRTEVGQWIDAGGPVCEMVAIEKVKVRADVPDSAVAFARVGEPATISVEATEHSGPATISRVIPRAEPAARTFPVEVDLPNPDHTLLPGMFVWMHVPAGPSGSRLMVPKDAIVSQGLSKQIFVIRPGQGGANMAIPTPVTTGLEVEGLIEIRATGVAAGDSVVVRANERLFGPTPVTPMPSGAAASRPADAGANAAPAEGD